MIVVFKMRESVPTARYSPVCNVLRQWKTSLILTYRVYRLYDKYAEYVPKQLVNFELNQYSNAVKYNSRIQWFVRFIHEN